MGAIPSPRPRDLRTRPWPSFLRSGRARLRQRRSSQRAPQASRRMGPPLRRPERRGHPSEARVMKRKPANNIDLMARGPSFERAAWLANMLRMADRREIANPTDDDIQEMRRAIGDDLTFEKLSDANKTLLFCAMLTIRQRLQIYDQLVKFEEEEPGRLLSALTGMVATIPKYHGLLSV